MTVAAQPCRRTPVPYEFDLLVAQVEQRHHEGTGAPRFALREHEDVIAPTEKQREAMAQQLGAAGFKGVTISAQSNHSDARDVVHFATMHRAKGLEFDAVVVLVDGVKQHVRRIDSSVLLPVLTRCLT